MKKLKIVLIGCIVPVVLLALWVAATHVLGVPKFLLPPPESVLRTFLDMLASDILQHDILASLSRVVIGFLLSGVLGVGLGVLIGLSPLAKKLLYPTLSAFKLVPVIAWIPLVVLWCGIGEPSKIVIIVMSSFFPIMLNTLGGIYDTPAALYEVAALYKKGKWKRFCRVCLPSASRQIFMGLKVGLAIAWLSLIAAELMAGTSGLGFRMAQAKSLLRSDIVVVCMIVIAVIGLLLEKLMSLFFYLATPWLRAERK